MTHRNKVCLQCRYSARKGAHCPRCGEAFRITSKKIPRRQDEFGWRWLEAELLGKAVIHGEPAWVTLDRLRFLPKRLMDLLKKWRVEDGNEALQASRHRPRRIRDRSAFKTAHP